MCLCQVTGSESGEDGNGAILCAYSLPLFCSQPEVSSQKLTDKMPGFFVNSDYMTFCDLQGHWRSDALVQNERLYMNSYL